MLEMTANVYGIEQMELEKIYYFSYIGDQEEIKKGDLVIINTELGEDIGKVVFGPREMSFDQIGYEPTTIIRRLTSEDMVEYNKALCEACEVTEYTKEKVKELNLKMRCLKSKYTFDKSRLVIYFGADSRVDFRELVKELAKKYRVRIELRQVGIRDEVKIKGSLGLCGQVSCCCRFLREFDSIKMELAKTQQMMINTAKISGRCGKLLCCLKYENQFYEEVMQGVPYENTTIEYDGKPARVITVNVFLREVTLQTIEENQPILIKVPFDFFKNNSFITFETEKESFRGKNKEQAFYEEDSEDIANGK
jgi:cell fate regulator YaaT (PSP1 superfamily)